MQDRLEAEPTEVEQDEDQQQEWWGTESEREHGGRSGQFHLRGDASDKGRRSNIGHQEEPG